MLSATINLIPTMSLRCIIIVDSFSNLAMSIILEIDLYVTIQACLKLLNDPEERIHHESFLENNCIIHE